MSCVYVLAVHRAVISHVSISLLFGIALIPGELCTEEMLSSGFIQLHSKDCLPIPVHVPTICKPPRHCFLGVASSPTECFIMAN